MQSEMRVILGAAGVKAYVVSPKNFGVVGIVSFGQEYGLLATDVHGNFYRINGSQIVPLNSPQVLRAIAVAHEIGSRHLKHHGAEQNQKKVVPVFIRKQRHCALQPESKGVSARFDAI
jgi:hypothetical protein